MQAKINEHRKAEHEYYGYFNSLDAAMVMKERKEIRPSYMLNRGEYDPKGEVVERDIPEVLWFHQKGWEIDYAHGLG